VKGKIIMRFLFWIIFLAIVGDALGGKGGPGANIGLFSGAIVGVLVGLLFHIRAKRKKQATKQACVK
jgi:hypothetical protein